MKKRALLTLLPLALVVTGCSGNLKKASIFNQKFLDMNTFFSMNGTERNPDNLHFDDKYEYTAQKQETLNLGSEVTAEADLNYDDLLALSKADGSKGYFNLSTRKICVPVEKWKDGLIDVEDVDDYGFIARFYEAVKVEEEKEVLYIYDDYGNKIYSGENGAPSVQPLYVSELSDNVGARCVIYVDGIPQAYATYAVDFTLKEVISADEFIKRHPYDHLGESLEKYGHPELIEVKVGETYNETRYMVFNTKKEKYVSSFAIPKQISGSRLIHVGDYYYYQIVNEVHEREKKYDYAVGTEKFNVETYRVNYKTGKVKTVKTNLLFASFSAPTALVNEKGIIKYAYVYNAKYFDKDKTVNPVQHSLILDQKLNVAADVSGIPFLSLRKYGDYYLAGETVYDSKLREVGYISGNQPRNRHIVLVNGLYGLIDHTGKYLVAPTYDEISVTSQSGDYFRLRKDDTTRLVKINEKEELVEILSFTNEQYLWSTSTCAEPYVDYEKVEDHKHYLLNEMDGTFTPAFAPEAGDVDIAACEGMAAMCNTYITDAYVFQRGSEYYAVYYSTHITHSLPEFFPRNK